MSSKTKIVVLHMKELIYTAIFALLGILLIILLVFMFLPGSRNDAEDSAAAQYTAGVYTSSITLNEYAVDVEVVVDEYEIQSVSIRNLDETVTTMYPLIEPALDEIAEQIYEKQTTEGISYSEDNQYTSTVLLGAIDNALEKARVAEEDSDL